MYLEIIFDVNSYQIMVEIRSKKYTRGLKAIYCSLGKVSYTAPFNYYFQLTSLLPSSLSVDIFQIRTTVRWKLSQTRCYLRLSSPSQFNIHRQ